MEQPSLSSSRAVVVYLFLYCLVSSSLLFDISGAHAYVKQVANGTGAPLLIKRLESPSSNLDFMELLFPESHFNCEGVVNFTQKRGFIKSPNYPNGYTVPLFCRWNIVGAVDEIITISLTLIDIEIPSESPIHCYRTAEFQASLCCARNYLKITSSGGGGGGGSYSSVGGPSSSRARDQSQQQQQQQQLYCGDSSLQWQTYTSTSNVVAVEFNALDNYAHARGFYLEYSIHPRRSAALAAASATSADDSAVCPEGKFQCAASKLCIDAERRCNGVADCDHHHIDQDESHPNSSPHVPDFSDELNCTSQLCRPEKGAFLCSDGRCILSPWSCDQDCSDEKGGTPGTVGCMKNSVITAAIIGSLVCLLLIVIAISCAIRLFGLRHSGHYRSSLLATGRSASPTSAAAAAAAGHHGHHSHGHHHHHHHLPPFADSVLPFPPLMSTGDLDASLFRLDHSVFLREPPPSYASTMGGYADVPVAGAGGVNGLGVGGSASASASYMEQYRRYRRQRRCRRLLRRQQRMAAGGGGGGAATAGTAAQSAGDVGTCTSPPPIDEETLAHHRQPRYHHHHQGHQFVNPLPLSPTAAAADISLRGMAHHHHHHQFASVVGLRINPIILSDSSAAVGLPALPSSGAFNGGSSATTATTLPPPSQPPPSFQANILQQESCFEVGGGTSSSSTSKMKKKGGTSLTSSDLNHLNTQCNSSPGGGGVATSTTFGVLPFSSASSSAASTSAASSAGAVDAATALTIELEPIPPLLTNFDCDSLPLIR